MPAVSMKEEKKRKEKGKGGGGRKQGEKADS